MKVRITLSETERITIRTEKKGLVIDTEDIPIFKGKTNTHQIQDVLYYEYLDPKVKEFLERLDQQEAVEEWQESEQIGLPTIEVEELEGNQ